MSTPNEPAFVLHGPTETLVADDVVAGYPDVAEAQAALRAGEIPIIVGALPFDIQSAAALMAPRTVRRLQRLPDWATGPIPGVHVDALIPSVDEHRARICRALDELRAPGSTLDKVVLARALRLTFDAPLDARILLRRLADADSAVVGYLVDLSSSGPTHAGAALVGASPELLVERVGQHITCRPFAGSAPRSADPERDRVSAESLAASGKNRYEHQVVIDTVREALVPLCTELQVAPNPQLSSTAAVWHLSTPIRGRLRDPATTALDLALALHPTPAVGGAPTGAATALIAALEGDRGFYAGAVGWCDARGDGRFVVAIRCAQLSADRRSALAHAGGGIVAQSDADDEVTETALKFATILTALEAEL